MTIGVSKSLEFRLGRGVPPLNMRFGYFARISNARGWQRALFNPLACLASAAYSSFASEIPMTPSVEELI